MTNDEIIQELLDQGQIQPKERFIIGEALEQATAPLHNEIIHLQVQLRQAQEAAREEGIMEERHRCLADMCWMCKANRGVRQVNFEGAPTWIHPEKGHSYGSPCGAQQIRRRWSQESTS